MVSAPDGETAGRPALARRGVDTHDLSTYVCSYVRLVRVVNLGSWLRPVLYVCWYAPSNTDVLPNGECSSISVEGSLNLSSVNLLLIRNNHIVSCCTYKPLIRWNHTHKTRLYFAVKPVQCSRTVAVIPP